MVAPPRFGLGIMDSKSTVLPLDYGAIIEEHRTFCHLPNPFTIDNFIAVSPIKMRNTKLNKARIIYF